MADVSVESLAAAPAKVTSTAHAAVLDLKARIGQSVLGQDHLVESLLIGLLANGNLLLESLPGLAKTRAVKIGTPPQRLLASEAASFAHLRRTARIADPPATYFALLNWLARFEPAAPAHTVAAFRAAAQDAALDRQLELIETYLFSSAATAATPTWSPRQFMRRVAAARRRLRRASGREMRAARPLPGRLNPRASAATVGQGQRPVAR
jgi:hypothetical protein